MPSTKAMFKTEHANLTMVPAYASLLLSTCIL